ncbi:hypothetical protein [Grimontia marina]|uniref:Uncharacterized protein n=1 Tax=Grimontia marina TaxID=646534 RepID=A0A128ETL4_9GAMM|nr:hypothetical protein [Grimontia marina]CZF77903.1 hypothetical protein GMA8713_00358 [Grimontia marina]
MNKLLLILNYVSLFLGGCIIVIDGFSLLDYAISTSHYHFGTEVGTYRYLSLYHYVALGLATISIVIVSNTIAYKKDSTKSQLLTRMLGLSISAFLFLVA